MAKELKPEDQPGGAQNLDGAGAQPVRDKDFIHARSDLPHLDSQSPVEPWSQRLQVAALDRGAGPDAQAGRGVAVVGDVAGGVLGVEARRQRPHERRLPPGRQARNPGVGEGEAHRCGGARRRVPGQIVDPAGAGYPFVERRGIGFGARGRAPSAAAAPDVDFDAWLAEMAGKLAVPLGRFGEAEEFANIACFLASDAGSYITGTAINVDGNRSPVV